MAAQASLTIQGSVTGVATGSKTLGPVTITQGTPTDANAAPITSVILASGDNTITIPSTTCVAAVIQFASGSTTTKKLKGHADDVGIIVTKNGPVLLSFAASGAPASFIINSSALDTANTTTVFWI